MKRFLIISLFAGFSFAAFWVWVGTIRSLDAPIPQIYLFVIFALPVVVGAIFGAIVSAVAKKNRANAFAIAFVYLAVVIAWVGEAYFTGNVVPRCQTKVEKAYWKDPSIDALSAWCVDQALLEGVIGQAVGKSHRESFDWILAQGVTYPNPDCARLGMSVDNHDLGETERLLGMGVSPNCQTRAPMPITRLFNSVRPYTQNGQAIFNRLLAAGARLEPGHLLNGIRRGNHKLLAAALEHVDPNAPIIEIGRVRSGKNEYPLGLAIERSDIRAIKILIDAGAVPLDEDDLLFSVPGFALIDYAGDKPFVADWKRRNMPPPAPKAPEADYLLPPLPGSGPAQN